MCVHNFSQAHAAAATATSHVPSTVSVSPAVVTQPQRAGLPRIELQLDESHLQQPWYFANMRRAEAEARLLHAPPRAFVVRPSSQPGLLSLSHKEDDGAIGHGIIYCWRSAARHGYSIENSPDTHPTIEALLLSLPLRHEDYAMRTSRGVSPAAEREALADALASQLASELSQAGSPAPTPTPTPTPNTHAVSDTSVQSYPATPQSPPSSLAVSSAAAGNTTKPRNSVMVRNALSVLEELRCVLYICIFVKMNFVFIFLCLKKSCCYVCHNSSDDETSAPSNTTPSVHTTTHTDVDKEEEKEEEEEAEEADVDDDDDEQSTDMPPSRTPVVPAEKVQEALAALDALSSSSTSVSRTGSPQPTNTTSTTTPPIIPSTATPNNVSVSDALSLLDNLSDSDDDDDDDAAADDILMYTPTQQQTAPLVANTTNRFDCVSLTCFALQHSTVSALPYSDDVSSAMKLLDELSSSNDNDNADEAIKPELQQDAEGSVIREATLKRALSVLDELSDTDDDDDDDDGEPVDHVNDENNNVTSADAVASALATLDMMSSSSDDDEQQHASDVATSVAATTAPTTTTPSPIVAAAGLSSVDQALALLVRFFLSLSLFLFIHN